MELTLSTYLIVCPLVFLAGLIDSVAGGGGLISIPAYYLAGLPPVLAAGTNKLSVCPGTSVASLRFARGGRVDWTVAVLAALGAFPGSWLGTMVLQLIPEDTIRIMMVVIIPLVAAVVLLQGRRKSRRALLQPSLRKAGSLCIGFAIGLYDGIVGPGTGTFLILAFTMLLGMEDVTASGTAKIVNLTSNVAALTSMLLAGRVLVLLGLVAGCFGMLGNYIGAGMTLKKGAGFVRGMMLVVLALLLAKMVVDVL